MLLDRFQAGRSTWSGAGVYEAATLDSKPAQNAAEWIALAPFRLVAYLAREVTHRQ